MKERRSSGPPYSTTKIRENYFLQIALWDQGCGGGELKSYNSLEATKLERGETKRSYQDIQQGTTYDMVSQQFACCIYLPKDPSVKELSPKARVPTEGLEPQEVINNPLEPQN